mmetsp:Transcript_27720/g.36063  ORF Transcript_27720/g.36063 Transcript_27720/m.36063 type:complete len:291 (+) Transcript_27720:64-936(+)
MEMDTLLVPTVSSLVMSPVAFLRTNQCTHSDVLAVTATSRPFIDPKISKDSKSIYLPKREQVTDLFAMSSHGHSNPFFGQREQAMRERRNQQLHSEHEQFFARLQQEKQNTIDSEHKAACKIQSTFRGFIIRLNLHGISGPRSSKNREQMTDIIQDIQKALYLSGQPPMPGHPSHDVNERPRRWRHFEHAMAIKVQALIRMFLAQRTAAKARKEWMKNQKTISALVIQCAWRGAQDRKIFMKLALEHKNHAAITIQRAFRGSRVRYALQLHSTKKDHESGMVFLNSVLKL